jgi:hypothetical protein
MTVPTTRHTRDIAIVEGDREVFVRIRMGFVSDRLKLILKGLAASIR